MHVISGQKWRALEEQVRSVLKEYPDLRLTKGRKVLEIRPSIKWDKGNALQFLLESLGECFSSNHWILLFTADDDVMTYRC
jgi:trehalose 6-phosphate phosphatase